MRKVGPFEQKPRVAVAVSGGSDSIALCALMARWTYYHNGQTVALTVNHGLRPEAIIESYAVAKRLSTLNIPHYTLTYEGLIPQTSIQIVARTVRYKLLEEWCRVHGILHLALAHHQNDQVETIFLRIAHGSGIHGLAAMSISVCHRHVRIIRPLLKVVKSCLKLTCLAEGLKTVDDPSNYSMSFARVRARHILSSSDAEGINVFSLSKVTTHLTKVNTAINTSVLHFLVWSTTISPFGFAALSVSNYRDSPKEIVFRSLSYLLQIIGGGFYPPNLEQLETMYESILLEKTGWTLSGCQFRLCRRTLLLSREYKKILPPSEILAGDHVYWDKRFMIILKSTPVSLKVGALGMQGWKILTRSEPFFCDYLPDWIGQTLPALYTSTGIIYPLILPESTFKVFPSETEKIHAVVAFTPNVVTSL